MVSIFLLLSLLDLRSAYIHSGFLYTSMFACWPFFSSLKTVISSLLIIQKLNHHSLHLIIKHAKKDCLFFLESLKNKFVYQSTFWFSAWSLTPWLPSLFWLLSTQLYLFPIFSFILVLSSIPPSNCTTLSRFSFKMGL